MAGINIDTNLANIDSAIGGSSAVAEYTARRPGWYRIRINASATGSGSIPILIKSAEFGRYGYLILPEELSYLSAERYNPVSDSSEVVFYLKTGTGAIQSDVPASVSVHVHHYVYLERNDILCIANSVTHEIDYVGPHRPVTCISS